MRMVSMKKTSKKIRTKWKVANIVFAILNLRDCNFLYRPDNLYLTKDNDNNLLLKILDIDVNIGEGKKGDNAGFTGFQHLCPRSVMDSTRHYGCLSGGSNPPGGTKTELLVVLFQ